MYTDDGVYYKFIQYLLNNCVKYKYYKRDDISQIITQFEEYKQDTQIKPNSLFLI